MSSGAISVRPRYLYKSLRFNFRAGVRHCIVFSLPALKNTPSRLLSSNAPATRKWLSCILSCLFFIPRRDVATYKLHRNADLVLFILNLAECHGLLYVAGFCLVERVELISSYCVVVIFNTQ